MIVTYGATYVLLFTVTRGENGFRNLIDNAVCTAHGFVPTSAMNVEQQQQRITSTYFGVVRSKYTNNVLNVKINSWRISNDKNGYEAFQCTLSGEKWDFAGKRK